MRTLRCGLVLAVTLLLGACTGPAGEAELDLGSGETAFEPVEPGAPVPLIAGAQGGYHVWMSMRTEGLVGQRMEMFLELEPTDGSMPPQQSSVRVWMDVLPGARAEFIGWPALIADAECYVGREIRVRAALTDERGTTAVGEMIVVPERADMPACGD